MQLRYFATLASDRKKICFAIRHKDGRRILGWKFNIYIKKQDKPLLSQKNHPRPAHSKWDFSARPRPFRNRADAQYAAVAKTRGSLSCYNTTKEEKNAQGPAGNPMGN